MFRLLSTFWLVFIIVFVATGNVKADPIFLTNLSESNVAKIVLLKDANKITVRSVFINGTSGQILNYKIVVEKSGKSGTSNNAQSGTFEVKEGQKEVVLSTSGFNINPQDKYFIKLQVFQGKVLISQDTYLYESSVEVNKN
jgi:hypothetical protein